jgi:glutaredoxin
VKLDKKIIFAGVATIAGLVAIVLAVSYFGVKKDAELTYFYYSLVCPHCKIVEEYMAENNITDKIKIVSKEVSESKDNAEELLLRAGKCGYKMEEVGVPMIWKDGVCIMGDQPIIDYFKQIEEQK